MPLSKNDVLNIIDAAMRDHKQVKPSDARVLHIMIKDFRNSVTGACYPSVELIAERCGMSRSATFISLNRLKRVGFISWTKRVMKGKQTTNLYNFHLPGAGASESKNLDPENTSPSPRNDDFRVRRNGISESTSLDTNPVEGNPVEDNPVTGVHSEPLSACSLRSSEDDILSPTREAESQLLLTSETFTGTAITFFPDGVRKLRTRFPLCDTMLVLARIDSEMAQGRFPLPEQDELGFLRRLTLEFKEAEWQAAERRFGRPFESYRQMRQWAADNEEWFGETLH
ncbi:helix-turn-helix domain-containing protein [Rhizobium mongolense]|uniref:helix-turn-helix domain-containing protein n=1 Tax=Rhizobium mongolense TaxID=57676 RepID=UPI003558A124